MHPSGMNAEVPKAEWASTTSAAELQLTHQSTSASLASLLQCCSAAYHRTVLTCRGADFSTHT